MIEANLDAGCDSFDRVVANEHGIYVRMYVDGGTMSALAIMTDNDTLQTKFIGYEPYGNINAAFISNPFHIVIDNVWTDEEASVVNNALIYQITKIHINNDENTLYCTWTSTVKPDNTRVELNCKVVETSGSIVTAKCDSETTWPESVFNRIPIRISGGAQFGSTSLNNQALFGTNSFSTEGSITQSWDGSTRYNVTGSGTSLTINNQFTIKELPTDFVSHWVNIGAEALMGKKGYDYIILVPPNDS